MNEKAQSPAEFIIVTFVFIILLILIFTGFLTKIHPEIEKARAQEACLNSNSLATYLLKEPGQPSSWTDSDMSLFGLSNGSEYFVSYDKWLTAKSMGYVNLRNKTFPDTSYLIDYKIYAFKPLLTMTATDICAKDSNAAVICRFNQTLFQINASSSQTAVLNLKILIPFSYAAVQDFASLETNDIRTTTVTENETIIVLELHTSPTDSDKLNITSTEIPKLVFIQKSDYKTAGDADLQIFIGNTSVVESLGSASTGANNYCKAERATNIVGKNDEIFPARFGILAW